MLAAAIRVDRPIEGNIRRVVGGDDLSRLFFLHLGAERRQEVDRAPAVVELGPLDRLEAAGAVRLRAAAVTAVIVDAGADDEIVDGLGRTYRCEFAKRSS